MKRCRQYFQVCLQMLEFLYIWATLQINLRLLHANDKGVDRSTPLVFARGRYKG